jgi:threonine/homoserine/homoserine lactone efflux protein
VGPVIGDILPLAIGVAISPIPIIAVILMLFSERARQNGPAFLGGWIAGLLVVVIVVMAVADSAGADSGQPSNLASLIKLGLGVLLIVLAWRQWQGRPRHGEEGPQPAWMATIDTMEPTRAALLGAILSGVNPKNLALAVGAALVIAQADLGPGQGTVSIILFVALASISIIVPVALYLAGGESARNTLDGWKTWLGHNNATVMTVLLLVMGVVLVGKGLGPLVG